MQKLLICYIKNIRFQNKIYENYSNNILQNMNYKNSKSTNFTSNSGKFIINLIDNFNT